MENHPIPQDVTGFQFRLIGNMTIKQFLYLATGSVLAWIFYLLPIFAIIKFPLIILFFLSGFALAFVPVEGRPMDLMLFYFIKALFSENQFVYAKTDAHSSPTQTPVISAQQIPQLITQTTTPQIPKQPEKKAEEKQKKEVLEKEAQLIKQELEKAKSKEDSFDNSFEKEQAHKKTAELQALLQETMQQKETLEKQLLTLQSQLTSHNQKVFTPTAKEEVKTQTQYVKTISKTLGKSVGLPITPEDANVITGIVKDPRGNILPNILIEVKDKDGMPARAFKTNVLGQFASATPLSNGIYTIEFEDPGKKHAFDAIEIEAKGEIILPLEVTSVDERERLRKELFNTTQ